MITSTNLVQPTANVVQCAEHETELQHMSYTTIFK